MGLVSALAERLQRSFENPATSLSDPAAWLLEMFGGGKADSGIDINQRSVLGLPPLLRAVTLISTDVAKLPLLTYRRLPEGGKERARDHPVFALLRYKPNPEMTAFHFKQTITGHALLNHGGYGYIWRSGSAEPLEIWLLDPNVTYPVRKDGVLWYVTKIANQDRKLNPRDVLHIKGLGYDGLSSYPIIEIAKDALGLGLGVQKYRSKFFASGAQPSIVLEHPGQIGEKAVENLAKSWTTMHGGLDKAHRPAILEEDMKLHPFSANAKDSQLAETLPFTARDVSCITGVPSHKLGDPERKSYASLEQENQAYHDDCVDGWLSAIEEECRDKLLTEQEKRADTHTIEFLREALVRADMKTRYEAHHMALLDGWKNRDEVRAIENLNPMPDGKGQEFFEPLNMGKAGIDSPRANWVSDGQRIVLTDALERMVRRISTPAERKAKQGGKAFFNWLDEKLVSDHERVIVDAITPPVLAIAEMMPDSPITITRSLRIFLGLLRERLLTASECKEAELADSVAQAMLLLEKECSAIVMHKMLKGE